MQHVAAAAAALTGINMHAFVYLTDTRKNPRLALGLIRRDELRNKLKKKPTNSAKLAQFACR